MNPSVKHLLITSLLALSQPALSQVPILIYHAHPNLGYEENLFRSHMDFLKENGYNAITPDQFMAWRLHDEPLPPRPVLLTVDDNYILLYESMWPILRERGQVIVNFTIIDSVAYNGSLHYCDWDEIREMEASGAVISESHSRTHPFLSELEASAARNEVFGSLAALQEELPADRARYFAYPYGDYDDFIRQLLIEAGYAAGFSTIIDMNYRDTPIYDLRRIPGDGVSLATLRNSIGFNDLPPAPPGEGWTLDNGTAHFTYEPSAWNFRNAGTAYGGNHLLRGPGTGQNVVRWATVLPETGYYRVHARWVAGSDRATSATYTVHHASGASNVVVNQQQDTATWKPLGQYFFRGGHPAAVNLSDKGNGMISADAVWFEPVGDAMGDTIILY